jgi:hypothetical protein
LNLFENVIIPGQDRIVVTHNIGDGVDSQLIREQSDEYVAAAHGRQGLGHGLIKDLHG